MTTTTANTLVELAEDGAVTWEMVARAAIAYMSEDHLADMIHAEGLVDHLISDDDEKVFAVSVIRDIGTADTHVCNFTVETDDDADQREAAAEAFAEQYCNDYNVTVAVTAITDNGGSHEEINRFEPIEVFA